MSYDTLAVIIYLENEVPPDNDKVKAAWLRGEALCRGEA
jgi:hypothetical protein